MIFMMEKIECSLKRKSMWPARMAGPVGVFLPEAPYLPVVPMPAAMLWTVRGKGDAG
jgi:hypothetical protein